MKRATVADLRNRFPQVFKWIAAGEQVEVTRRGRVVARIVPAPPVKPRRFKAPAFAERARAILGDSSSPQPNLVEEERATYPW
jgi:prevent-host-death family protein